MGKFAILAQKAIFTEGVGSTSGFVQVWVDGITMNKKSLINFSSSLTLRYSSKQLNFNNKQ
jgi:hypothetical protein